MERWSTRRAHTAGSISVLLSSGEAIAGDLLMGGWLGGMFRSGQPGYPYYADDLGQIRASVKTLLDLGATKVFVGHGGPLEAERVRAWLERAGADYHLRAFRESRYSFSAISATG